MRPPPHPPRAPPATAAARRLSAGVTRAHDGAPGGAAFHAAKQDVGASSRAAPAGRPAGNEEAVGAGACRSDIHAGHRVGSIRAGRACLRALHRLKPCLALFAVSWLAAPAGAFQTAGCVIRGSAAGVPGVRAPWPRCAMHGAAGRGRDPRGLGPRWLATLDDESPNGRGGRDRMKESMDADGSDSGKMVVKSADDRAARSPRRRAGSVGGYSKTLNRKFVEEPEAIFQRFLMRSTSSLAARLNIGTLLRVVLPAVIAAVLGYAYFDNISLFLYQNWLSAGEIQFLSSDEVQFIPSFLQVLGLLFSILAGNAYSVLYEQQETIYFALFQEVSEAKSLLEQTALICQVTAAPFPSQTRVHVCAPRATTAHTPARPCCIHTQPMITSQCMTWRVAGRALPPAAGAAAAALTTLTIQRP